jgi:PAS domain S-box-containing protein
MNHTWSLSVQAALDALPAQVFSLAPDLRYIAANIAHTTFIDRELDTIIGKPVDAIIPGGVATGIPDLCRRALTDGRRISGMVHMPDRMARHGTFVLTASPLQEKNCPISGIICHAVEVGPGGMPASASLAPVAPNAPSLSKADLLARDDRVDLPDIFTDFPTSAIRYILNAIPYGIVIIDMNKRIRFINDVALTLSGYRSDDDLLGRICHRVLCPTEMDHCPIMDFGMSFDRTERKLLTESGIEIPVLKTSLSINLGGEDFLLETFIDLRKTKELADAYQRSEERYQTFFENTGSGMLIYDESGNILLTNGKMHEITGRDRIFFRERPSIFSMVAPEDQERLFEEHVRFISTQTGSKKSSETEFRLLSFDGSIRNIRATVGVIPGTRISIASLIDITDLRKTEAALMLANQKLVTLNRISRHDINNQLTAVLLILEYLQHTHDRPIGIRGEPDLLGRAISLVNSTLLQADFTREYESVGVEAPAWINLNDTVTAVAGDPLFSGIRIDSTLPATLEVLCDAMITKVFYNLFENAMRHGDGVTEISLSFEERQNVGVLTIRDDGIGIPDEKKPHIFTEGFGKNTGLGLFIIYSVLALTDITIKETGVYTEGAAFEISIPKKNYRYDEQPQKQG